MPTVLKETVKPMVKHSSKSARKMAGDFIRHMNLHHRLTNCEAERRAKNVSDAKARDLKIKKRAEDKAKKAKVA